MVQVICPREKTARYYFVGQSAEGSLSPTENAKQGGTDFSIPCMSTVGVMSGDINFLWGAKCVLHMLLQCSSGALLDLASRCRFI